MYKKLGLIFILCVGVIFFFQKKDSDQLVKQPDEALGVEKVLGQVKTKEVKAIDEVEEQETDSGSNEVISRSLEEREAELIEAQKEASYRQAKDKHGVHRIMMKAFEGDFKSFELLLDEIIKNGNREDLNTIKDKEGASLLHWSVMGNCSSCVQKLLQVGFDANSKNKRGETPLLYAVGDGNEVIAAQLLKAGANPNETSSNKIGQTMLMDTAFENNAVVAKLLIEANADVEAKNHEGQTALHIAAREGNVAMIKLLLDKGAKAQRDNHGKGPRDYAREFNPSDVVDLIPEL